MLIRQLELYKMIHVDHTYSTSDQHEEDIQADLQRQQSIFAHDFLIVVRNDVLYFSY